MITKADYKSFLCPEDFPAPLQSADTGDPSVTYRKLLWKISFHFILNQATVEATFKKNIHTSPKHAVLKKCPSNGNTSMLAYFWGLQQGCQWRRFYAWNELCLNYFQSMRTLMENVMFGETTVSDRFRILCTVTPLWVALLFLQRTLEQLFHSTRQ